MLGGSFSSRRLQPSLRCAVPAQLLAFRRFLFRPERLCHSCELLAAIARRFWRRTVSPAAAGQALSAAFCNVDAFCRPRTTEGLTEDPDPGNALVGQPDNTLQHSPTSAGYNFRQPAAYPKPPHLRFLDLECGELEHQHGVLHLCHLRRLLGRISQARMD